jgi:hypothetical protein
MPYSTRTTDGRKWRISVAPAYVGLGQIADKTDQPACHVSVKLAF